MPAESEPVVAASPASFAPLTLRVWSAPKEGNQPDQYEDAWAHSPLDGSTVTLAVADGASAAVFARQWANLLVLKCAGDGLPTGDTEAAQTIVELGKLWRSSVESKATSWHAQEKLLNGSHATLLIVNFDREKKTWTARARGDVCVFLVRNNKLRFGFPVTKSAQFGDRPDLIGTEEGTGMNKPAPSWKRIEAACEPGDRFYFATDAVAAWFLHEWEKKRVPWNHLPPTDAEPFAMWLKQKRDKSEMKNDDVTLIEVITD